MRRLVVLVAVLAGGTAAAEENRLLARARAEVEALELEAASRTLQEALAAGTTSPADTQAIYLLLGEVAASMGDAAKAEENFRRALSLAPTAGLAMDTSPKIVQPFAAARAWVEKAGPLKVSLQRPGLGVVALIVDHDPLRLVAGARARWRDRHGLDQDLQGAGAQRNRLVLPSDASGRVVVTAVDARGNALAEIAVGVDPGSHAPGPTPARASAGVSGAERPWLGRWGLWGAAALVFAGAAGAFAIDAVVIDRRIGDHNAASSDLEFHDVAPLEDRVRRDLIFAQVGAGLALGCAAAAVFVALRPSKAIPRAALAPGAGGLLLSGSWTWTFP